MKINPINPHTIMKTLSLIITSLLLIANLQAQNVLLSENFTTYDGTSGTAPAGWTFSSHAAYTSTTSSGPSGPNSYKFGANNVEIITPEFPEIADSVIFWIKGVSSTDFLSKFLVEQYHKTALSWDTLIMIPITSNTGTIFRISLDSGISQLKFTYIKSTGNLAFDDFSVTTNNSSDFIAPVITLNGSANITTFIDTAFADPGATAFDDVDGDITNKIVRTGLIKPDSVGIYTLYYNVSDSAGNAAQEVTRVVTIIDSDTIPPVITLNGANPFTITVGGSYVEPGATAMDNVDGDLTSAIIISGTVDSTQTGIYSISYSVTDMSANSSTLIREVHVYRTPGKSCAYPFFSEYIDPASGNTKVIEIFNPTDFTIDLSEYVLHKFVNGSPTSTSPALALTGMLLAGKTFIISHDQADSSVLVMADMKTNFLSFNGDDGLLLMKNSDTLDLLGRIGQDPGTSWSNSDSTVTTADMVLRRKPSFTMGIISNPLSFDPSVQWLAFAAGDFSGLGNHQMDTCDFTTIVYNELTKSTGDFTIFPNPAQGKFNLILQNKTMNISGYEIRDLYGKIIIKNTLTNMNSDTETEINVNAIKPGFYFLTFLSSGNSNKSYLKFIIIR